VTPGATALTLMPKNEVSRAVHLTSILSIDMEVEKITDPGWGVSPALEDKTVMLPLLNLRKGIARDMS
jgi:hypothetical protein